ncbi:MAG: hypothetical protein ONB44_18785 [candidate division KSB1 bacterium]|nr:hypothetical protein [candidate division KSB1 bacterium]MDZ7304177.1 hypothetical protein [candidate division KSB1 bacterium]MDZ7310649.1 hypothetical protein [candidate division KSB1 bacterium]
MPDKNFLILGGAGLVGLQVAFRIANDLTPEQIVIASLYNREVREALDQLKEMFGNRPIQFKGVAGNIFVRSGFADKSREWLLESYTRREALYEDLLGPVQNAYEQSQLVKIIREYRPDVIIDCINTATAISYQDVYAASRIAKSQMDNLVRQLVAKDAQNVNIMWKETEKAFETLLLSEAIPQLVRHVILLNQAMREVGTRIYVKVGTTGTGGMGLNIPYTHGEDKPSAKLMSKTAVAFAHTGLLFLMARTLGGPIVKEIKPGAMIGYRNVSCRTIHEHGQTVYVYTSRTDRLAETLVLRADRNGFEQLHTLDLPVVDTGENGLFTKGEYEAITSLRQMEFITPEEIARDVVLEIKGSNTGKDVIAAIDGAVMNPTYRAGYLRQQVLDVLERLEQETETHSVALGQLGPPQLSKLLWEAELLHIEFGTLEELLAHTPEEISMKIYQRIQEDHATRQLITSIGVPILAPSGNELIRGPFIRIPEVVGAHVVSIQNGNVDEWAAKGWVDLRPKNFTRWQERFRIMERARQLSYGQGSAAITRAVYPFKDIRPGTIVGWIFNNEEGYGYRIK